MTFKQSPAGYSNVKGPIVQKIQAQLNLSGHNAGPEDGAWGRSTVNALKAWQEAQGLAPTAVVDDQVWTALVASPVPDLPSRALQQPQSEILFKRGNCPRYDRRVDVEFSGCGRKTSLLNDLDKDLQVLCIHR